MAGYLPKKSEEFYKIAGAKIAIIASQWHRECVDGMVNRAVLELKKLEVLEEDIMTHYVPGSLELPYAASVLFERFKDLDAILAFGVVLKGATTHDDTVIRTVVEGFQKASQKFSKPIINEVIGVLKIEDAIDRAGDGESNKGLEAVFAVSELINWERSLVKIVKRSGF